MKRTRVNLIGLFLLLGTLVLLSTAPGALAANQVVSNCGDTGDPNQLRQKLTAAQGTGGGTITFTCSGTIMLQSGILPTITTNTTINGGSTITVDGNHSRIFNVNSGVTLTLNSLTLYNGFNSGDGGAIYNNGTLNISSSKFISNGTASGYSGGAIESLGTLNITNSEFANNKAGNGGALFPRESTSVTTITNSKFHDNQTLNTTNGWGGAMLIWNGAQMNITSSDFVNNTARQGGAFYVTSVSSLNMTGGSISSNHATAGNGGGIYSDEVTTLHNVSLSGNSASLDGGSIFQTESGAAALYDSTVTNNTAQNGGGIYVDTNGHLIISSCTVNGNQASGGDANGGGLYVSTGATALVEYSVFDSNHSEQDYGGAIYNAGPDLGVNHSTLSNNTARNSGGGIYNDTGGETAMGFSTVSGNSSNSSGGGLNNATGGTMVLSYSTLSGNQSFAGAALFNGVTGTLNIFNSTVSGNTASHDGGGVEDQGQITLLNTTFSNNTAPQGGALYILPAATAVLTNTILAYSPSGGNCNGKINSAKYSISSDKTCALAGAGDHNGLDPLLKPLGFYGGPTKTNVPKIGSPAIDGVIGNDAPPADQRSIPRPQGSGYDIGAVEVCKTKPAKPTLLKPGNGKKIKGPQITLDWNDIACIETYSVMIRSGSPSGPKVQKASKLTASTFLTKALVKGQTYYWQVTVIGDAGKAISDWWRFIVK